MQSHRRSIVKAVSYRVFATATVFAIAFLYTGDLSPAAKIGVTAAIAKTTLYYLWERVWNRISWGRQEGSGTDATVENPVQRAEMQTD